MEEILDLNQEARQRSELSGRHSQLSQELIVVGQKAKGMYVDMDSANKVVLTKQLKDPTALV